MNHESEEDGFRSRDNNIQKHRALRLQIYKELAQYKQNGTNKPYEQFKGVSQLIAKQQEESQSDMDMFEDNSNQLIQRQDQKDGQKTDECGYYNMVEGTLIGDGKYRIIQKIGKGIYGIVVKAEKLHPDKKEIQNQQQKIESKEGQKMINYEKQQITQERKTSLIQETKNIVAIKIIRKNSMMIASGERQYEIVSSLKKSNYVVQMLDYFFQEGHLCLVLELLGQNLRAYTHKNQDKVKIQDIRQYTIWMLMSLHQLQKNGIIHADIKPDNFIFTLDKSKIKLSDFGTAYRREEHNYEIDEMVARYYRAPEIILGYPSRGNNIYGIDLWAAACTIFELYTGQFLFTGNSNNELIKQMMQTKGRFSCKMLQKSMHTANYFDKNYNFIERTLKSGKAQSIKTQLAITSERQIMNRLKKHSKQQDPKKIQHFRDFLEKCLMLNPKDRPSLQQAFEHPFLNYQIKLS